MTPTAIAGVASLLSASFDTPCYSPRQDGRSPSTLPRHTAGLPPAETKLDVPRLFAPSAVRQAAPASRPTSLHIRMEGNEAITVITMDPNESLPRKQMPATPMTPASPRPATPASPRPATPASPTLSDRSFAVWRDKKERDRQRRSPIPPLGDERAPAAQLAQQMSQDELRAMLSSSPWPQPPAPPPLPLHASASVRPVTPRRLSGVSQSQPTGKHASALGLTQSGAPPETASSCAPKQPTAAIVGALAPHGTACHPVLGKDEQRALGAVERWYLLLALIIGLVASGEPECNTLRRGPNALQHGTARLALVVLVTLLQ